jgi:hypothetical protein
MPSTGLPATAVPPESWMSSRLTMCVAMIGAGDFQHPLQRVDRVAVGAEIVGDEVGLAVGQHRDRRRIGSPKWPPL